MEHFHCSACNKNYLSKASIYNHNRLYHNDNSSPNKNYECRYCIKKFRHIQSRWVHEKKCSIANPIKSVKPDDDADKLKEENEKLKTEKLQQAEQIIKLQNKLLKTNKLDNKTFKAINKILMDRSYKNSNNNNNITNSNNTINNNLYQIQSIGNEDLVNVLTLQQKKQIINSRLCSLEKIVEITHCGDYNQFKNIIITNLKDNFAYKYDDRCGYFVTLPKNILFDDVVSHRVTDIEAIYDELQTANKIDQKTKKLIQDFLDKISNEDTPFFDNDTKYQNYKTYKINNIKILLYNNQDKITKDIALLISDKI